MMRWWWLLLSLFFVPAAAIAGPNAGGTLVVHDANLLLSATDGSVSICGQGFIPDSCAAIDAELDSTDANTPQIWVVYAAFPDSSSPRLMGVTWGVHYHPDSLQIVLAGRCGDFELNDDDWPDSDTGSSVTWNTIQTSLLAPVYWFAGYQYTETATTFDLRDHPSQGGRFGDDAVPALLDEITDYGRLGFGTAGYLPCPGSGGGGNNQDSAQPVYDPFQIEAYSIRLREFDLFNYDSPAIQQEKAAATAALRQRYGGSWRVYSWNPQTGTAGILYGTGAQVASPFAAPEDAVAAAEDVIADNEDVLHADLDDLRLIDTPQAAGTIVVHYEQTYSGLPVIGGRVDLTFTQNGTLTVLGSGFYSDIDLNPTPSLSLVEAEEIARTALPFYNASTDSIRSDGLLAILPEPLSETSVQHHLVWRFTVCSSSPMAEWVSYVDAHSGEIVRREDAVARADFYGTVTGPVFRRSPCSPEEVENFRHMWVNVVGVGSALVDSAGIWRVDCDTCSAPKTVLASFNAPPFNIHNFGCPELDYNSYWESTRSPGTPIAITFADSNSCPAERTTLRAMGEVLDFCPRVFGHDFPNVTEVSVNEPNLTCNGSANNGNHTVHLGLGNAICHNPGTIMGGIQHEFGHIFNWDAYLGNAPLANSYGKGEGNADIFANFLGMTSAVMHGYFVDNCHLGYRDSHNALRYPEDVLNQEAHHAGSVLAGFQWDATEELMRLYGPDEGRRIAARAWNYAVRLRHEYQWGQVFNTFLADSLLGGGSNHYDAYRVAAHNHGFEAPVWEFNGACCHPDSACKVVDESQCSLGWVWMGVDTACDPDPCPAPETTWRPMEGGFDGGQVLALREFAGEMIAGGDFWMGNSRQCIARWDGSSWAGLGSGLDSCVRALQVYRGKLVAGGDFTAADTASVAHIAQWDGSQWTPLAAGLDGSVRSFTVYNGDLIAGGEFTHSGQASKEHVAAWDGTAWRALGAGTNGPVYALSVHNGDLIAGGSFSEAGGESASNIARWDGAAWHPLRGGTNGTVLGLAAGNAALFVGGEFHLAGDAPASHIAEWFNSEWGPLGAGTDSTVLSLQMHGVFLLVGGSFTHAGAVETNHITRCWRPTVWAPEPRRWEPLSEAVYWNNMGQGTNDDVMAIATFGTGSEAIIGGTFTTADGDSAGRVARWSEYPAASPEMSKPSVVASLRVVPNPIAGGKSTISYSLPEASRVDLEVFSVTGAVVRRLLEGVQTPGTHAVSWDGRGDRSRSLPAGVYFVRMRTPRGVLAQSMVLIR